MGRIVRYVCSCGFRSEELLLGEGEGEAFRLVEAAPHSCPRCKVMVERHVLKEGVTPESMEREVGSGQGSSFRPLGPRALLSMAEETRKGARLCPLCRMETLLAGEGGPPPCPCCGGGLQEVESGTWY